MLPSRKVSSVPCPSRAAAGGTSGDSIKEEHQMNSNSIFEELHIFAVQADLFRLGFSPGGGVFALCTMSGI